MFKQLPLFQYNHYILYYNYQEHLLLMNIIKWLLNLVFQTMSSFQ